MEDWEVRDQQERQERKELLELAAKAAGIDGEWDYVEQAVRFKVRPLNMNHWNPLDDDGDALRLAVKLGMFDASACHFNLQHVARGDCAGTRRAIVLDAAEIGKR